MDYDDFTWLEHPETGGKQRFGPDAVDIWKARGWVECGPPDYPNPTQEPPPPAPPVDVESATEPDPTPQTGDVPPASEQPPAGEPKPTKTTRPRAGNTAEEA